MNKVIVAGAGGFIGGHLVSALRKKKNHLIRAVDIKPLNEWYQVFQDSENLVLDLREKENCFQAVNGFNEVYNQIAAFYMTLLAEKMDKFVFPVMYFVNICGNITQNTFCPDFIKENRHKLCKLFGEVVDWLYGVVKQLANVSLKQVGIFNTGTGEFKVYD